jgi:hypothetical protein
MNVVNANIVLQKLSIIKKRRKNMWFMFIGYIPFVLIVLLVSRSDRAAMYAAFFWMALFVIVGSILGFSRCQKCKKLFFIKLLFANPFSGKCLHCGVDLNATHSDL